MTDEEFKISTKFNIDSKPLIIDGEKYYSETVLKLYAKGFLKHEVNAISDEISRIEIRIAEWSEERLDFILEDLKEVQKLLKQ